LERESALRLVSRRRLTLVVDLDNTILHAIRIGPDHPLFHLCRIRFGVTGGKGRGTAKFLDPTRIAAATKEEAGETKEEEKKENGEDNEKEKSKKGKEKVSEGGSGSATSDRDPEREMMERAMPKDEALRRQYAAALEILAREVSFFFFFFFF
jgi:hypothetical protein